MKKLIILLAGLCVGFASCKNDDQDFPDYKYSTVYFPYQTPVRTIVLGSAYTFDNTNDNLHRFVVSGVLGGVYDNKKDRAVKFSIETTLCDGAKFSSGKPILPLPESHYTLSSPDQLVISRGSHSGGVTVQLTEAFFSDPLSYGMNYVLPVRMTETNDVDSILCGKVASESIVNPDVRADGDWQDLPKNFTMFAVKYVNRYHGNYLHRGSCTATDKATGSVAESVTYAARFIESDPVRLLSTTDRYQVTASNLPVRAGANKNTPFTLVLNFTASETGVGTGTVGGSIDVAGTACPISGTATFAVEGDEWGGKKRNTITATYSFDDGTQVYSASDVFVIRDRNVGVETYKINL